MMAEFLFFRRPVLLGLVAATVVCYAQTGPLVNTLSPDELAGNWQLLFDGKTLTGWVDPTQQTPAGDAWTVEDGCLKATAKPHITEDLLSKETYRDFELVFDWRISPGGNSGVKYRIQSLVALSATNRNPESKHFEDLVDYAISKNLTGRDQIKAEQHGQIYVVGFEYQLIDNARHPDARRGPLYQSGSLYSMVPPTRDATHTVGEFNHSRLVVKGNHVEHWLNGEKVVDTTLDSDGLKDTLSKRWGKTSPTFQMLTTQPKQDCPISLQNHGDTVWFRSIKIRRL